MKFYCSTNASPRLSPAWVCTPTSTALSCCRCCRGEFSAKGSNSQSWGISGLRPHYLLRPRSWTKAGSAQKLNEGRFRWDENSSWQSHSDLFWSVDPPSVQSLVVIIIPFGLWTFLLGAAWILWVAVRIFEVSSISYGWQYLKKCRILIT